jgi:PEP-CTERM motif
LIAEGIEPISPVAAMRRGFFCAVLKRGDLYHHCALPSRFLFPNRLLSNAFCNCCFAFLGVVQMKKLILSVAALGAVAMSGAANAATTYVGSFQVDQGANWTTNPTVYSAAEAAALLFGGVASDYDISTAGNSIAAINNLGWYSTWGIGGGQQYNENFKVDLGAPGYNAPGGSNSAVSAYVNDNAIGSTYTNYVFRVDGVAGAVPEASTWMMMLAGFGLAGGAMRARRRQLSASAKPFKM